MKRDLKLVSAPLAGRHHPMTGCIPPGRWDLSPLWGVAWWVVTNYPSVIKKLPTCTPLQFMTEVTSMGWGATGGTDNVHGMGTFLMRWPLSMCVFFSIEKKHSAKGVDVPNLAAGKNQDAIFISQHSHNRVPGSRFHDSSWTAHRKVKWTIISFCDSSQIRVCWKSDIINQHHFC